MSGLLALTAFGLVVAESQPSAELLKALPVGGERGGREILVEFQVNSDFRIRQIQIMYRTEPTGAYNIAVLHSTGPVQYSGLIKHGRAVEYYLTVVSVTGTVYTIGSTDAPRALDLTRAQARSGDRKRKWWLAGLAPLVLLAFDDESDASPTGP